MSGHSREQALSLLAAAKNHGDLAVKLSSLRQVKVILSSMDPFLAAELFPYLSELQSSSASLVRKLLIEVVEEIGLKLLEHSSLVMPVLLLLSKDSDPVVSRQSIVSCMKFLCTALDKMALQFHKHGKVERWAEEIWTWMLRFKDAMYSFLFEPVSVGMKLLALQYLEIYILLLTPDMNDSDKFTSGGKEHAFNISMLFNGHPFLDPVVLKAESNKFLFTLLDLLRSKNSLPGPLTICVVNCLAAIARKRPQHYDTVFSALLDFTSNFETVRVHTASVLYSLRTAFLGFLRCTHPAIVESREILVRALRAMNAGDAADQVLRQVDKMMKNNERASRNSQIIKDDQPLSLQLLSGDVRKRAAHQDDEEPTNGPEMGPKRLRYSSNDQSAQALAINGLDHPTSNGFSAEVPLLNSNLDPVEQMIAMIGALLAEGERGAESLELLISQIHPDLLADIVITTMKHLPKTPPNLKIGSSPVNVQHSSSIDAAEAVASDAVASVQAPLSTTQGSLSSASAVNVPLPDITTSTNLTADSKRDPRRDPRRLDPRRAVVSVEASSQPLLEETTSSQSGIDGPVSGSKPISVPVTSDEIVPPSSVSAVEVDGKIMSSLVSETDQTMLKEDVEDGIKEISTSPDIGVTTDDTNSSDHVVDKNPVAPISSDFATTDAADAPFSMDSDEHSPVISNTSATQEICEDLPQIPSYIELSGERQEAVKELAVEQILRSYKHLRSRDSLHTRIALVARLVSQIDADGHVALLLQKDIILDYQNQQGHELVMHVLYHLHSCMTSESGQILTADVYEKFLLGVAKALLDTFPASDKSFSKLLGEAPILPESVLKLLGSLCCSDSFDQQGKDVCDGDRITQGLGAVWSLILGRPVDREACLNIALKCAVHSQDDIRAKAIRLVANKLYLLGYISENIEHYATNMLLSAVDRNSDSSRAGPNDLRREEVGSEETSISGSQISEPGNSEDYSIKGAQPASFNGSTLSFNEAQRLISLYFALCTKKPSLLQLVFDVYGRAAKTVKQAIHRHIPILIRASGPSCSELLRIISDPPKGSENLLMLVLQILMEQSTPSPDLIATVKHLYETKLKDAVILIPMLSSLSKHEVLPIFPRLVDLPLDKFQTALAHILQGSAHTGPALTPAEVLVAIHDIIPEKEGIALKKVTDACSACFEQRMVFTEQVLEKALNQMVERTPLPLLFMRTVIQAIDAYPTLVDFVMEILSKLVVKQIWKMPKLWVGFLKCVSQTQPHSFRVLLQLPAPQLESALSKHSNLRVSLAAFAGQPTIRASLPRSIMAVLGLSNESHLQQQHLPSQVHPPDTSSSVHGATLT
ncbi:hypothetical protein Nepgr_015498 [Nepenthes gracilis]|uniref:Symplekin n=1 Tax=Nepenthes gracilis TaxID=150966 RepID=A0AAD3SM67_NEPGR|nr:hypothetical protein Nepgr_015498 [Nepenthes gracilis]